MSRARWLIPVLMLVASSGAVAQEVGRPGQIEFRVTGGGCKCFLDEKFPDFWIAGGSLKFYVGRRVAIQPEYLYRRFTNPSQAQDFIAFTAIPHIVVDLGRANGRVHPYVLGGVGVSQQREKAGTTWLRQRYVAGQGGVGARLFLSKRVYLAPEVRFGNRQFVQMLGSLGFVLN